MKLCLCEEILLAYILVNFKGKVTAYEAVKYTVRTEGVNKLCIVHTFYGQGFINFDFTI